jgi:hypothetical protein
LGPSSGRVGVPPVLEKKERSINVGVLDVRKWWLYKFQQKGCGGAGSQGWACPEKLGPIRAGKDPRLFFYWSARMLCSDWRESTLTSGVPVPVPPLRWDQGKKGGVTPLFPTGRVGVPWGFIFRSSSKRERSAFSHGRSARMTPPGVAPFDGTKGKEAVLPLVVFASGEGVALSQRGETPFSSFLLLRSNGVEVSSRESLTSFARDLGRGILTRTS